MPSLAPSPCLPPTSAPRRPRRLRRWSLVLATAFVLWLPASACSDAPCKRLEQEICTQAGEAVCAQYKASAADAHVPEDAKQKACQILLNDKQTLKMTLEALKRSAQRHGKAGPKDKAGAKKATPPQPATTKPSAK